jgi:hypothetical protein
MLLDDKLGLNSDALPDASAAADAEAYASADSSSNTHELAGANADPEAAGGTDAGGGGAANPSSRKRAHSCVLPLYHGPKFYCIVSQVAAHAGVGLAVSRLCDRCCGAVVARM